MLERLGPNSPKRTEKIRSPASSEALHKRLINMDGNYDSSRSDQLVINRNQDQLDELREREIDFRLASADVC